MSQQKRVVFRSRWLPWLLLAPQALVIGVFFFWPAAQALLQSLQQQDAFGLSTEWVGLANFQTLFNDDSYLASFKTTAVFSLLVAVLGLAVSLLLATMANRVVRGAPVYKTLLIWPYAVAPAIAGVLWLFMFAPSIGVVAYGLQRLGVDWNHLLNADHAMTLVVMAAVWKQVSYNFLFFLAGLQSIPASMASSTLRTSEARSSNCRKISAKPSSSSALRASPMKRRPKSAAVLSAPSRAASAGHVAGCRTS